MNLASKNFYELLGVDRTATVDQIKLVYKEIARVYHPDSNFYDEILDGVEQGSGEMDIFKVITAAYNTLIHEERRKEYDASLPPELPDWDNMEAGELSSRTNWDGSEDPKDRHSARKRKPTGTFGREMVRQFGTEQTSSFDDIEFGRNIEPVSSMFRRPGFFSKFRRFLGL